MRHRVAALLALLAIAGRLPMAVAVAAAAACGTVVVPPAAGLGTPPSSIVSLSPFLEATDVDAEAIGLLYYNLIWVTRHQTIDWSRSIATGIEVSHHDTVFTVTMRPWHWSDGQPVTSADVAFTYELIRKMGPIYVNAGIGGMPGIVKRFTVLGPEKFQVVTTHPVNPEWFEFRGLSLLIPYPAHIWARYSINQMYRRQSDPNFFKVVDGAYQVQSYKMGRYISFIPNPSYQGHRSEIARFVMPFLHSSGAEIEGMQSGALDISNLPFSLWRAARRIRHVRIARLTPVYGFQYIQLNFVNPKVAFFRQLRVRQAIADAIDQRAEIKLLFHGNSHIQHGPLPVDPPIFLSPAARAGHYPVAFNPARARQLLDQAGWIKGPGGIRTRHGKQLAFTFLQPTGGATQALANQMIQQNLRAVGIAMTIRQMTFNQMIAIAQKPQYWEAMGFGWTLGGFPSDAAQFHTGAAYNQGGYSDPHMDALLDAVNDLPGSAPLDAYQDYAAAQEPAIFLPAPASILLVRKGLRGVRKFLNPIAAWSPQYLHWTTPACRLQSDADARR